MLEYVSLLWRMLDETQIARTTPKGGWSWAKRSQFESQCTLTPPNSTWVFNMDSHTRTHSYVHNQTEVLWLPLPHPLAACILGPSELQPLQNSVVSCLQRGNLEPELRLKAGTPLCGQNSGQDALFVAVRRYVESQGMWDKGHCLFSLSMAPAVSWSLLSVSSKLYIYFPMKPFFSLLLPQSPSPDKEEPCCRWSDVCIIFLRVFLKCLFLFFHTIYFD